MVKLKSANHHWWPRGVSRNWAAEDGTIGWIKPDGTISRVPSAKLGMIGNGHHIKLGESPGKGDPWDSSFEKEFDEADNNFSTVISWMKSLNRRYMSQICIRERFLPQPATEKQLKQLTESVVSLAIRSPRNREASVSLAEQLRGPLLSSERNVLIGLNMRQSQRIVSDSIGGRAKFAVLFSKNREFIFGDGFFYNFFAVANPPHSPKILAPITPWISVIICRPSSFVVEPPLSTLVLTDDEVERCNDAVQIYSRRALFFRSQQPTLSEHFLSNQHLTYANPENFTDNLINSIPGVP